MKKYINVLCVLILALMLADLVLEFCFTGNDTVTMKDPSTFSMGGALFMLVVLLVAFGALAMTFVYFIRFILNVNRNQVFTAKNVSLLRKYGVCAIVVGVCLGIFSFSAITGKSLVDALSDCTDTLGEGFFALLMAELFGMGQKLMDEKKASA